MKRKDCDRQTIRQGRRPARLWPAMAGCVLFLCCAQAGGAGDIRIRAQALIDRDQIRLGDVAVFEGFAGDELSTLRDLQITSAPDFGHNKLITLDDIRVSLDAAGLNIVNLRMKGSSRCVVRRPAEIPAAKADLLGAPEQKNADRASLRGRIQQFLEQRVAEYGGELELGFGKTPASLLALSEPGYTFKIEPRSSRRLGTIDLLVTISQGRSQPQTHKVTVTAALKKGVVVAVNTLVRGQTISSADVMVEQRSFKKLEKIGLSDLARVIGQEAKQVVRVGNMIKASQIKSKVLVQRNELLSIRSTRGGIAVASTATALSKGVLGDTIEVLNEASQETFWVRVTGLRRGEIMAGPGDRATVVRWRGGAS